MRKSVVTAVMTGLFVLAAACMASAAGNWSRGGEWLGDENDAQGVALARKFAEKIDNTGMSIPVYEVMIGWSKTFEQTVLPITVNQEDVSAGKPAQILWTGRYNGHIEDVTSQFSGSNDTVQSVIFTSSEPNMGRPKLYAMEGLVTWSTKTRRDVDKIVIVWDNAMRSHVYLGVDFNELMEKVGVEGLTGYEGVASY